MKGWFEMLKQKFSDLIDVKTIVTFTVTAVFAVLAFRGTITAADVKEITLLIFTFFFAKKAVETK
jgi:hypothetical protein